MDSSDSERQQKSTVERNTASVDHEPSTFVYRNPLDLLRISYADIVENAVEGVYVEAPGTARTFLRAPPAFHDDPAGVKLFPAFDAVEVRYPPVFTASLRNVTLKGFRSVLTSEGYFVNDLGHLTDDNAQTFARGLASSIEMADLVPTTDGAFALNGRDSSEIHLSGPVVILSSAEPGNFGSFIYRELPKLINLSTIAETWRFLAHLPLRAFDDFLKLAGVPIDRIVRHELGKTYRIDQAIIPGLRNPFAYADAPTLAFYEAIRDRCYRGEERRRIYVSRRSVSDARPNARVMRNEDVLISRLRSLDFEIVEPQHLTAAEQVEAFASAGLVVGPSGSGMFNAVFCKPGTKLIDIESEPHWIYPHTSLFASRGLEYGIFEGQAVDRDWSVHHKAWTVDIDTLVRRIESFALAESSGDVKRRPSANLWLGPQHKGDDYTVLLQRLHAALKPSTYLEIGVSTGVSLELASCRSIAIDPHFAMNRPVLQNKPSCFFFQMTGDHFFNKCDPWAILGAPVDMAFLDGMHWYEYLLRDFINVERHCRPNSVVLLHDCLPSDEHVGRRDVEDNRLRGLSPHPDWWAGDVWKVLAILVKHRPDLQIVVFSAPPTGLVAITNLDPSSTFLPESYFNFVKEFEDQTLAEHGSAFFDSIDILDPGKLADPAFLSRHFWL
jgi:Glycosyltransferase 61